MTHEESEQIKKMLLEAPLADLDRIYNELVAKPEISSGHLDNIATSIEQSALRMLRVASYIEGRSYFMQTHKDAVKKQNKDLRRVRKALGFVQTHELNF